LAGIQNSPALAGDEGAFMGFEGILKSRRCPETPLQTPPHEGKLSFFSILLMSVSKFHAVGDMSLILRL
jgi:hypothetical protein